MIVLTESRLVYFAEDAREKGKVVVTTNGAFDITHVGHKRYLEQARSCGDLLVVLLNSDASVRRLKGDTRPFVPEEERAEMIDALRCVDITYVFDEDNPLGILRKIKPDYHVKGGTYIPANVEEERKIVEAGGGRCIYLNLTEGKSTTNIAERILSRNNEYNNK